MDVAGCAAMTGAWRRSSSIIAIRMPRSSELLDAELAAAAILRVASRTESRNMITRYLIAHPTALVDGGSGAPDPVARLIEELIARGGQPSLAAAE